MMRSAQYTVSELFIQARLSFSHHVAIGSTMSQYWRDGSKNGFAPQTKSTLRNTSIAALAFGSEFSEF